MNKSHLSVVLKLCFTITFFTSVNSLACMIGEIRVFAGDYAPAGWAFANGQRLTIKSFQGTDTLYSIVGGAFSRFDDETGSFALPDFRGRIPVGIGQGAGLSNIALGGQLGKKNISIQSDSLPIPSGRGWALSSTHAIQEIKTSETPFKNGRTGKDVTIKEIGTISKDVAGAGDTETPVLETIEIENTVPALALNYIICIKGEYPTQDHGLINPNTP